MALRSRGGLRRPELEERVMEMASPVAVVTGGGRGIGRGIALALAEIGHTVIVNYRSDAGSAEDTCCEARRRGSPLACAIRADVSDLTGVSSPSSSRRWPSPGGSISGSTMPGSPPRRRLDLLETTVESWDQVLGTNLRGPFFLSQAVARAMVGIEGSGDRGRAANRVHHLDLEPVRQRHRAASIACPRRA